MRCLACDDNLSDKEAGRKFTHWRTIVNPEDRYIGLCTPCLKETDIEVIENPLLDDVVYQDEKPKAKDEDERVLSP